MNKGILPDDDATLGRLRADLLVRIGGALLDVQLTEQVLRLVTTYVLQKSDPITAEQILAQVSAEQKKTLGYFVSELRKRADIDVHFDRTLSEFLRRRNILAHNLSDIPGWDLGSSHGIYRGRIFLNELIELNAEVLKVFTGLVRAWEAHTGNKSELGDHPFFREVDERYVPLIGSLFFAKG